MNVKGLEINTTFSYECMERVHYFEALQKQKKKEKGWE